MDLILTSFGVSHLQPRSLHDTDIFYRMPPASLSSAGQEFMPDYAALLMADQIVIDQRTYEFLTTRRHDSYSSVAAVAKALYDEGFVRLEDFDSVIAQNRQLLTSMLERDMRELDSWVMPLRESLSAWRNFASNFTGGLLKDVLSAREGNPDMNPAEHDPNRNLASHARLWLHESHAYSAHVTMLVEEALSSSKKRRESFFRNALREVLSEHLSYVNANLLLANELNGGLYDWSDFRPYYHDKLLRVARLSAPGEHETETVKKLFEVSFPEFTFWTPASIVRALKDKRIVDLRKLVDSAVRGEVTFDREFAVRVLEEVLTIERSIGRLRNLVSYVTLPLGLIPWVGDVVQKVAEEAIVQPVTRKRTRDYRWFYMISDMSERARRESQKSG